MKQRSRPIFCWETRAIEKCLGLDAKFIIVDFHGSILGRHIQASWFKSVVKLPEKEVLEGMTLCQFPALVCLYTTALNMTMVPKEFTDDVKGKRFRVSEKCPYVTRCLIHDQEVRRVAVV